ncbi:F-box domain-containing protein [Histoplasma capsulatum G186AR]|uniref:F-box domain-containing protein n=2 Tax=Ajellomyces capsulatus TaxID=5037 RepID=C0NBE8_AJECG|nr:F-box domain-containing protein [Histoplasma capsulatum G186AR]EEH10989.1 F-box domain-containing protein [Histoplasma capsulatum G186AR]KAG5303163.1 F-box domain-containing protein [Histoplasma capsulatum]QSS71435.1 F-box domain-containing protein [Histoplasma capsulatum G186AR]
MEDGDSNPPWNRLENPVSIGSDMTTLGVVAGPLTPYLAAEKPASRRLSTGETVQQNDRVLSNPQCQGRGLLGLLPSQIIEKILYTVDANSFASLALLNRKWRAVSDLPALYRYHLDGCTSPALRNDDSVRHPWLSEDLWQLKRRFARETRRNLFESFLRPQKTVINLISTSASSSSAFPQGEAFQFTFSANGNQLLALSSSRIFVIDLSIDPISVSYELKTLRRPVAAAIVDDASLLAVASSSHQANVYRLIGGNVKLIQAITLDNIPRTISLSPEGTVLAIAYDGSIEVHALGEMALATDRRAVRCFHTDMLSFSRDGLMLVGSSNDPLEARMVSISPPLYMDLDSELPSPELQSRMWTTQILSPDITIGYNNVTLVPSTVVDAGITWIVGYDTQLQVFRLGQIDDARGGFTYFVGPGGDGEIKEPGPSFVPTAGCNGELLVLGFQGSGVWLYGIPDVSDRPSASNVVLEKNWGSKPVRTNSQRLNKVITPPSHLIHGRVLSSMNDITAIKWVDGVNPGSSGTKRLQRLVAAAPGGVNSFLGEMCDGILPVDGGRIVIFDFARSSTDGNTVELTIEVGEAAPIPLPEQDSTMDVEVELERRRTRVNRRRGSGRNRNTVIERSATLARHRASIGSTRFETPPVPTRVHRNSFSQPSSPTDPNSAVDIHAIEIPYTNNQPRSQNLLSRAATPATPAAPDHDRNHFQNARYANSVLVNRRPLVPHESDADNWVPPPPPYTPDADEPLPDHIQRTLLSSPTNRLPLRSHGNVTHDLRRTQTSRVESTAHNATERTRSAMERIPLLRMRVGTPPETSGQGNLLRRNNTSHSSSSHTRAATDGVSGMISATESQSGIHQVRHIGSRPIGPPVLNHGDGTEPSFFPAPPQPPVLNTQASSLTAEFPNTRPPRVSSLENPSPNLSIIPGSALGAGSMPARVIGRNGPTDHFDLDPNTSPPAATSDFIHTENRRLSATRDSIEGFPTARQSTHSRSSLSDSIRTHYTYRYSIPPNFSPIITKPQAMSSPHLQSHEPRRVEALDNVHSNQETQHSRPRSQDIPRRRLAIGGAFFDTRSGRMISSSHSDAEVGRRGRDEELRGRMTEWSDGDGERKKRKEGRCSIL